MVHLQAAFRGRQAKSSFQCIRTAAISVQTAVRGRLARAKLSCLRHELETKRRREASLAEESSLACPMRPNTGRRMLRSSRGRCREEELLSSCRGETTPLSQPPLSSARPHADAREIIAEEAMGSGETPSQRDPKVSSKGSQNCDLVNASLKEGSLNPCSGA